MKTRGKPFPKGNPGRPKGALAVGAIATPPEARRLLNRAAIVRDEAERYPGLYNEQELLEVDSFEATALAYLYPEPEPLIGEGGALVPQDASASTASAIRRSPKVAALADNARLDLASEARADELAIDMEESAAAQTSIERAMTHQIAAAHAIALRLVGRVNLEIESMGTRSRNEQREAMVEIARLSNAASRLMQTYQQAALTLAKVRSGGKQTVVVQYVHVNEGGQAVIAGTGRGIG
jgi:hypothetical protein